MAFIVSVYGPNWIQHLIRICGYIYLNALSCLFDIDVTHGNKFQDELNQYRNHHSEWLQENDSLLKSQTHLQSTLTNKCALIDELKGKLDEITRANSELQQTLQNHTSKAETKLRDCTISIRNLQEKIEQLNYSINIYETENGSLEIQLKVKSCLDHLVHISFRQRHRN